MENNMYEKLLIDIDELEREVNPKTAKELNFDLLRRIVRRLGEFSPECEGCRGFLNMLDEHINILKDKHGRLDKNDLRQNRYSLNGIVSHLQKQHKLVADGQYLGTYMSLGMSIGLVLGLTVFDNIAIGMPIGMCLGIALGSKMDADAKKNGLTI